MGRSLLLLLTACSVGRDASTLPSRAGSDVTVELRNGREVDARVVVAQDGIALETASGNISLGDVARVRQTQRFRGLLHGLGLGVLIGGGVGAVIGFADGDDPPCTAGSGHVCSMYTQSTAFEKAAIGGIVLGALGGLVGAAVGLVMGSDDVYRLDGAPAVRVVPTGPPGSVLGATIAF